MDLTLMPAAKSGVFKRLPVHVTNAPLKSYKQAHKVRLLIDITEKMYLLKM